MDDFLLPRAVPNTNTAVGPDRLDFALPLLEHVWFDDNQGRTGSGRAAFRWGYSALGHHRRFDQIDRLACFSHPRIVEHHSASVTKQCAAVVGHPFVDAFNAVRHRVGKEPDAANLPGYTIR